ncbi:MAG: response regulator [Salinivirgaceae bacterium]|jgi:PAS domain S-box-containing protein|nr:response regulator [Salinivirgaceae bacterium]
MAILPTKILLIDDNLLDARLVKEYLSDYSNFKYDLATVGTLAAGKKIMGLTKFDVILLDLNLPDSNGIDTFEQLYIDYKSTPIIMLIGIDDEHLATEAIKMGAQDYLVKNQLTSLLLVRSIQYSIEPKKTEEKNEAANNTWQTTFDGMNDSIFLLDNEGVIIQANRATGNLLQNKEEDIIGKHCYKSVHHTDCAIEGCPYIKMKSSKKRETMILPLDDKWLEITVDPLFDNDGEITGAVHIISDITERKNAEVQIKRLNRVYALLSNINQTLVRIRNAEQLFKDVCLIAIGEGKFQGAWIGLFNYDNKLVNKEASAGFKCEFLVEELMNILISKSIKGGKHFISNNIEIDTKLNNEWKQRAQFCGFKSFAIFALIINNKPSGGFCIFSDELGFFDALEVNLLDEMSLDISFGLEYLVKEQERKTALQELIIAKEKAENADMLKTAFLANMSHEIRTPMNAVIGFSELIQKENLSSKEKNKFVELIKSNGESLVKIIDDIIDISKIDTKQMAIYFSAFNLKNLLDELYIYFSKIVISKNADAVDLLINISPEIDEAFFINSDKIRLKQVLVNLLNNAVKFTKKGSIKLVCELHKNKIYFAVEDTGIGIPAYQHKTIFDRFVQYSDTFVSRHFGTGLGLSISKEIVQLLGGKIELKSIVNEGSIFSFEIPFKKSLKELIINENDLAMSELDLTGKTILIVDDEESSFVLSKRILSESGASFEWAQDGEEAIELVKKNKYNFIIMDIKMPRIDGITATKLIKKQYPKLPIIIQTAFAMENEYNKALEAGCDAYITKPIVFDEFINKIAKLIV